MLWKIIFKILWTWKHQGECNTGMQLRRNWWRHGLIGKCQMLPDAARSQRFEKRIWKVHDWDDLAFQPCGTLSRRVDDWVGWRETTRGNMRKPPIFPWTKYRFFNCKFSDQSIFRWKMVFWHRGVQQQLVGFTGNKLLEIVLAMARIPSIGRTMKPKSLVGQSIVGRAASHFQFEDKQYQHSHGKIHH